MSWILIPAFIFTIIYLVNKYLFSYWTRRNVPQVEPTFFVGNIGKLFTLSASIGDVFAEIYNKYKHKRFMGGYLLYKPTLIVNDPVLIQDIMIRDFNTFHDRPTPSDASDTYPLTGNLFNLKGQKWRDLRVKLSPTFTSGKLKVMFPILRDCGKVLQEYIEKNISAGNKALDFKDLLARLTTNNISSIAFGVDNDCINDPDNAFRKNGLRFLEPTLTNGILNTLKFFATDFFVKAKIDPFPPGFTKFIYSLVTETIDFRKRNNFHRNDFMQLMIELKEKGYLSADKNAKDDDDDKEWKEENKKPDENVKKLTIDEIAAQTFIFFIAGYETSSSTMTFCLFELSKNKEIQRKVQEEIDLVMKKAGSDGITYDLLNEMKYLECCIDETLRKYPIVSFLFRICNKDFSLSGTDFVIEKGTTVFIPLLGIQRDPDIYDDPLAFRPERFFNSHNGNPKVTNGIVYAPFGDGPRNCIGARLGKLQAKLGLAMILQKFSCELQDKTMAYEELKFHPQTFPLSPTKNIILNVSSRS